MRELFPLQRDIAPVCALVGPICRLRFGEGDAQSVVVELEVGAPSVQVEAEGDDDGRVVFTHATEIEDLIDAQGRCVVPDEVPDVPKVELRACLAS